MNADRFVTLDLVAGFQKVSALTQDRALIVDVIRSIGGLEVRVINVIAGLHISLTLMSCS